MTVLISQVQTILPIFVLVFVGFCYSNCSASMSIPPPDLTSDHKEALSGVATLWGLWRQRESERQPALRETAVFPFKCDVPGKLTKETQKLLSLVKDAREKACRRSIEATSFISAVQTPRNVFVSFQSLVRELRRVLNSVKRHQVSQDILVISATFQRWYNAVQNVVERLRDVDTQPAQFWLQNVYLNLTHQREAFERMGIFICNFSSEAGKTRATTMALHVVSEEFRRELTELDVNWKTNTELLKNVSIAALNLDSALYGIDETAKELKKFTIKLEVMKIVNRRFRKLKYFLDAHTTFSNELNTLLAMHLGSNWIVAIKESTYSGFLTNLTAAARRKLDNIMLLLRESVHDLKRAKDKLPTTIYNLIGAHMRNGDQNETGDPPTLDLTDNLIHSLDVLIARAKPVSNTRSMTDRLVNQLQAVVDQ